MPDRPPGPWGFDPDHPLVFENQPGPLSGYSNYEQPSLGHPTKQPGIPPALLELLLFHATSLTNDAIRAQAIQLLGFDSFAVSVMDGLAAQSPVSVADFSRLASELVLADVYDRRWDILPQPSCSLERRSSIGSWESSLIAERLIHASRFRHALVHAVCETIQYPSGQTIAVKTTHRDRWL